MFSLVWQLPVSIIYTAVSVHGVFYAYVIAAHLYGQAPPITDMPAIGNTVIQFDSSGQQLAFGTVEGEWQRTDGGDIRAEVSLCRTPVVQPKLALKNDFVDVNKAARAANMDANLLRMLCGAYTTVDYDCCVPVAFTQSLPADRL